MYVNLRYRSIKNIIIIIIIISIGCLLPDGIKSGYVSFGLFVFYYSNGVPQGSEPEYGS